MCQNEEMVLFHFVLSNVISWKQKLKDEGADVTKQENTAVTF